MRHRNLTATALVTRDSLSYIENVFALNEARQPLVNVPNESFAHALTGISVDRCIVPDEGKGWFKESHPLIRDDRPAQVTYTSGTEGEPKGIVLSYSNLADAAERIIDEMGLTADVREYVGVPVTYSFGIGRIRAVSAAGGQSYLPPRGFDPIELSRMLKSGEVNALSAVPTLLRILLQRPDIIGDAGKQLRWLEIGSQFMTGAEKRRIRDLFPNARIVQHYGLTEASRSTFLQISDTPDELLESVGRPVGMTEVGISTDGRIKIRGPHVARWRLDADHLVDLCDADGWLQTKDLGHIKDGYVYFDGRADDLINVGGVKINPDMLEARIGTLLGHTGKIVVTRVPDVLRGEGILVATESADIAIDRLRSASAEALKGLKLDAGDALHVRSVAAIPRTATGKPLRRVLTEEFVQSSKTVKADSADNRASFNKTGDVQTFFREFFPGRRIGLADSFETMGGDSLSYIQFTLAFEDRFGQLPSRWESLTIAQLESLTAAQQQNQSAATNGPWSWRRLESATLTRAFFMICIVALHLDTFVYSSNWGAAYFLYMLAGYSIMRFQWPEIDRTGKVDTLFGTALRVAIPTFLVIVAMQLWARTLEPKPLLLISNWFDPSQYKVAYYYFAEIYIQLLLVVGALLSVSTVREFFRNHPVASCIIFLAFAMMLSWMVERVWDTNYIYHRTPIWYLWTIAAGMLMASAREWPSRVLAMGILAVAILMHHGLTSASGYMVSASALVLFWPEIVVPAFAKTIVAEIAASSMFMYLSHDQVRSLVTRLFHGPMPWIALFGAIRFVIVLSRSYHRLEGKTRDFGRMHVGRKSDLGIAGHNDTIAP